MLLIYLLCYLLVNSKDLPWGAHYGLNGFEERSCTKPGSWKVLFKFSFLKGIKRLYGKYNKLCPMWAARTRQACSLLPLELWPPACSPFEMAVTHICNGSGKDTNLEMSLWCSLSDWLDVNLIAGVMWVETNSIMTCPSVRSGDSTTREKV